MKSSALRPWVNVIAAIATIVVNVLAIALPLNGQNTGAISDSFKVFFVPAGYVWTAPLRLDTLG
jgi:benzodiazapine receptor